MSPQTFSRNGHPLHGFGKVRFTTWQWAVIASFFVAIVLSAVVGALASQALDNTERIDKALCVQIDYLEKQSLVSSTAAARNNLQNFAANLRPLVPSCPPPPASLR